MALAFDVKNIFKISEKKRNVSLRRLTLMDRDCVQKWLSDPYILRLTFVVPGPGSMPALPFSKSSMEQYLNLLVQDPIRLTYAIEVDGEHVGNIGLKEINQTAGTSEYFIEIGEQKYRGIGVGTAASAILLDYGLLSMGLREVRLEVLEFNDAAIRVYQRLGFERTHRTGWHYDDNGQYWQVWGMRLTRERWLLTRKQLDLPEGLILSSLAKV